MTNALNQLFNRPTNSIYYSCSGNREIQEKQSYGCIHSAQWRYIEVVNMTLWPHYPKEKRPLLVVVKRCGGLLSMSGICEKFNTTLAENQI